MEIKKVSVYNIGVIGSMESYVPVKCVGTIRIIHMSDTHDLHERYQSIPEGDIFIHSGDFTNAGDADEIERFFEFLERVPCEYKVVIAGNHDTVFDKGFYSKKWGNYHSNQLDSDYYIDRIQSLCCYLNESEVEIKGLKIYGSPYSRCRWVSGLSAFGYTEANGRWDSIPDDVDIIVTHGPPQGVLDGSIGCDELYDTVLQKKPVLHLFGHVHSSFGMKRVEDIVFVNGANFSGTRPIVIDLELD
eukprot:TRINITY_DN519_c0_g1_i2.p1 TRINITY_DN519_c0_g1~~TRINITY_DN519_c0_g1_i2.p1  ORF type:complete len:245 (-),score=46.46 TRINITY_DN519_c0_g1_i2:479-1213(-)